MRYDGSSRTKLGKVCSSLMVAVAAVVAGANVMSALATSPPGPPPLSLDEALIASSVVVAKGVKIHWIAYSDGHSPRVLNGPSYPDSHSGPILLEAEVESLLHCATPCRPKGRIFIDLERFGSRLNQLPDYLGKPLIYIVRKPQYRMEAVYPREFLEKWIVLLRDTRDTSVAITNPMPLSKRAEVEAAIGRIRTSSHIDGVTKGGKR